MYGKVYDNWLKSVSRFCVVQIDRKSRDFVIDLCVASDIALAIIAMSISGAQLCFGVRRRIVRDCIINSRSSRFRLYGKRDYFCSVYYIVKK